MHYSLQQRQMSLFLFPVFWLIVIILVLCICACSSVHLHNPLHPRTVHLLLADFAPESELADLSLWRQKTEDVWCGSRIVNGLVEWKFSVGPKLPFPLTVFRLVSWELISRRTDGASVTFITITPRTTLHNYTAQQHTTLHMDHSFSANNSSLDTVSDWR